MRADSVITTPIKGGVRFEVRRGDCRAKFDLHLDHVNWVSISSPGEGWLDDAHKLAREVFPEYGVKYLIAQGGTPEADAALRRRGWEETERGRLRLEV